MPFTIITTTNARKDIQDALDWENMRSSGFGQTFFLHRFKSKNLQHLKVLLTWVAFGTKVCGAYQPKFFNTLFTTS